MSFMTAPASTMQSLTAVDVGISVLVHVVRHTALNVGKARRLDLQNLETNGLINYMYIIQVM